MIDVDQRAPKLGAPQMKVKAVVVLALAAGAALAVKKKQARTEDVWKQATAVPDLR